MYSEQPQVIIYSPPADGLPYAIVAIVKGEPRHISFENTLEQARVKATMAHEALWRTNHFGAS